LEAGGSYKKNQKKKDIIGAGISYYNKRRTCPAPGGGFLNSVGRERGDFSHNCKLEKSKKQHMVALMGTKDRSGR